MLQPTHRVLQVELKLSQKLKTHLWNNGGQAMEKKKSQSHGGLLLLLLHSPLKEVKLKVTAIRPLVIW